MWLYVTVCNECHTTGMDGSPVTSELLSNETFVFHMYAESFPCFVLNRDVKTRLLTVAVSLTDNSLYELLYMVLYCRSLTVSLCLAANSSCEFLKYLVSYSGSTEYVSLTNKGSDKTTMSVLL